MSQFKKIKESHIEKLNQFVPIVARVHGGSHPEFFEVADIYNVIAKEIEKDNADLTIEFASLRKVTNQYAVPSDVCESFEAVYDMLFELDEAYTNDAIARAK